MIRSSEMMMFWMFAEKIKTGWLILNIIIWSILFMTLTRTNPKEIKNILINFKETLLNKNKCSFTLSFTIFKGPYINNRNQIDLTILGILYYITKNKINIKNQCSYQISRSKHCDDIDVAEEHHDVFFMPNDRNLFLIATLKGESIYCKFIKNTRDLTETKSDAIESENIKIILTSKSNCKVIQEFVNNCKDNYIKYTENKLGKSLKIFEPMVNYNKKNNSLQKMISFNEYDCKTTKDLIKNLFFKGKDELLSLIDHFVNNRKYYDDLGLPYQLGLLFYGEPGLGKTATIKSLSKYLHRHIIRIDLSTISSYEELREIFYSEEVNDYHIPPEKCIYVIEEIDDFEILHKRSELIEDKTTEVKSEEDLLTQVVKIASKKSDYPGRKKAIKLSHILEILDGIVEKPGRIIIVTTNHIKKIDPALIRPGRIDFAHEFQKADLDTCESIISLAYDIQDLYLELPKYIDGKYSPAELIQLCVKYKHSFRELLDNI